MKKELYRRNRGARKVSFPPDRTHVIDILKSSCVTFRSLCTSALFNRITTHTRKHSKKKKIPGYPGSKINQNSFSPSIAFRNPDATFPFYHHSIKKAFFSFNLNSQGGPWIHDSAPLGVSPFLFWVSHQVPFSLSCVYFTSNRAPFHACPSGKQLGPAFQEL